MRNEVITTPKNVCADVVDIIDNFDPTPGAMKTRIALSHRGGYSVTVCPEGSLYPNTMWVFVDYDHPRAKQVVKTIRENYVLAAHDVEWGGAGLTHCIRIRLKSTNV